MRRLPPAGSPPLCGSSTARLWLWTLVPGHDTADDGDELPADWADAAAAIVCGRASRILVLGPADVGKTSFCRAMVRAVAPLRTIAVLDADVGQKMIGPPACVTLGRGEPDGRLTLTALAFVGTIDPVRGWTCVVAALPVLAEEAGVGVTLVNTGGLLSGPGRRLKEAKIERLQPDLLIMLGYHPVLEALAGAYSSLPYLRLSVSPQARRKSNDERRRARRDAFRRYFDGAMTWTAEAAELLKQDGSATLPPRLLVGLRDERARDIGVGIIADIDAASDRLRLLTPVLQHRVHSICPGELVLDSEFRETRICPDRSGYPRNDLT
jgi:polynucleotide 5'-hydroxyl-kinase GRC3/NOL9